MTQLRKHYQANRLKLSERRAKKFANMRAAKERKRLECVAREEPMPDTSGCYVPQRANPLFTVTIRCRDGERVSLPIYDGHWGLFPSVTRAVEKVRCVLTNYRPIPT